MKKYTVAILIISLLGCTAQKTDVNYQAISQKEFLESPFGFTENIENFTNLSKPKFKTKKLLRRNKHYPEKTDTIYQFIYKKSEIFFYKTHLGQEFLLTGKIMNKQIILRNGVRVGLSKNEFIKRFSDKFELKSDSLQMIGEGTKYTFIFNQGKLYRINIDNYLD